MTDKPRPPDSPATLVAILVAAHKTGDRELELEMRTRLEEQYGVKLTFARERGEVSHA
jgi:hypothetical protein